MNDYQFKLEFEVRDYECDLVGMVNNSVYQNYLEHTRHKYLHAIGIDFFALAQKKLALVVVRIELDYKYSLHSGEKFWVGLNLERVSRIRFGFQQDIYRLPDNKLILQGKVIGTALSETGRPRLPEEFEAILDKHSLPAVETV